MHLPGNKPGSPSSQGVIYRKNKGSYEVIGDGQRYSCSLSTQLWEELSIQHATRHGSRRSKTGRPNQDAQPLDHDPLAVGDRVSFIPSMERNGTIVEVLPRQNRLSRRSAVPMPGAHPFEQVIVANIDQVIPVMAAADPQPKWNLLDRYLVTAESRDLPALVCITKIDLVKNADQRVDDRIMEVVEEYQRIGYRVVLVSPKTGEGIEEFQAAVRGKVSVLLGKSGVGKSSLLNAIQPGLGQRVTDVNQVTGKGRHTTTFFEMFPLDTGGAVVDTPGTREFGLWDIDEEDMALFFPEMRPYAGRCRFGLDCRHKDEPGCAIRKAVTAGAISPRRYQSFMYLQEDEEQ